MRLFLFLAVGTQVILWLPELPGNGSAWMRGAWAILATALLAWQAFTYLKRNRHMLYARLGLPVRQAGRAYVRSLFDDYAQTYDQHLTGELGYRAPQALLDILLPHVEKRHLAIADLGCGTGLCGPLFAPYARSLAGVDLSEQMLAHARNRAVYDEIAAADLVDYLSTRRSRFDLCLAADVLVYMGDLQPPFAAVAHALAAGGLFAFTLELSPARGPWRLCATGRYAHSAAYVRTLAASLGFGILAWRPVNYRLQCGEPVPGAVWLLQRHQPDAAYDRAQSVR